MKSQLDTIWQRIEQEKIKPLPKWVLVSRQVGIWTGFALSVFFGSLTLAYLVFIMGSMNADLLIMSSPMELFSFAPIVWSVAFIIFIALAFWSVEHTESGYKVHFSLWIVGNIAVTSIFALGFIALDIPRALEPGISSVLSPFSATDMEERLWHRPNQTGRIQGEIIDIAEDELTLSTPLGEEWHVLFLQDTRKPAVLSKPMIVRIIGDVTGERRVEAKIIIPVPKPFKRPPLRPGMPQERQPEIRGMIP